jgi:hypothetical protein
VVIHPSDWPAMAKLCLTFLAICLRPCLEGRQPSQNVLVGRTRLAMSTSA